VTPLPTTVTARTDIGLYRAEVAESVSQGEVAHLLGLAPPTVIEGHRHSHYRRLLVLLGDPDVFDWIATRWDASRRVFMYESTDDVSSPCQVPSCRRLASQSTTRLCESCQRAFEAQAWSLSKGTETIAVGEWSPTHLPLRPRTELCSVRDARTRTRCGRPALSAEKCAAHLSLWNIARKHGDTQVRWLARQTAYPQVPRCAAATCSRWAQTDSARSAFRCCVQHGVWWRNAVKSGEVSDTDFEDWVAAASPVDLVWLDIWLGQLPDVIVAEIMVHMASDRGTFVLNPSRIRALATAARSTRSAALDETAPSTTNSASRHLQSRWNKRLDALFSNPTEEWRKGQVRMSVVHPAAGRALVMDFDRIAQPWLEALVRGVAQARVHMVSPMRSFSYVADAGRLSEFLQQRHDRGMNPRSLGAEAVAGFRTELLADPATQVQSKRAIFYSLKMVFEQGQKLGLADRVPHSFRFDPNTLPEISDLYRSADEIAFPDATFAFLMGMDHVFGGSVFDLLGSVPLDSFAGEVAVAAVVVAANFGRRPSEGFSLTVDRIRINDAGAASLRYDDSKNRKDAVWLPIDRSSAKWLNGWIDVLHAKFPDTASSDLALLPEAHLNPRGTKHMTEGKGAQCFRIWVTLCEQAIVLAKLHASTAVPLDVLSTLEWSDIGRHGMVLAGGRIPLGQPARRLLANYRAGLAAGEMRRADSRFVFPCPFIRPRQSAPVSLDRFAALGADWHITARRYESPGIPGSHLGRVAIAGSLLQLRRFRHTYLQHAIDSGSDPMVVQMLAGHASIDTTVHHYVRPREERLQESAAQLANYRMNRFGQHVEPLLAQPSSTDVITNTCGNPDVHHVDKEGCDRGGLCYGCPHFTADPSNITDIDVQIATINRYVEQIEGIDESRRSASQSARLMVLNEDLVGWRKVRTRLSRALKKLPPAEMDRVLAACRVVRSVRNAVRYGHRTGSGEFHLED
jgi:hypothetical protein